MISNVASRNKTVDATLRHLNNTLVQDGYLLSKTYLKKGKTYAINNYVGSPADGEGYYGVDAGKTIEGFYIGGKTTYTLLPFIP